MALDGVRAAALLRMLQGGGPGGQANKPTGVERNTDAVRRGFADPTFGNIARGLSLAASFASPMGVASTVAKTAFGLNGGLPGVGGVAPFTGSISYGSLTPAERAMVDNSVRVGQTATSAFEAVKRSRATASALANAPQGGGRDISKQGGGFQGATAAARQAGAFGDRGGGTPGRGSPGSSRGQRGE